MNFTPEPALRVTSFSQAASGFIALTEKTARSKLTYRVATLVAICSGAIGYAIYLLVWREVYRQGGAALLPKATLFPYLVVAFVLNLTLTVLVEFRFMQRLRTGVITADLLRPLGFLPYQLAQGVGDVVVNALFALPVALVGFWFWGSAILPPSGAAAALGVLSTAIAFVVNFGISYLLVQACFVLQTGFGVMFTRVALYQVFSGLSAPLLLFPDPLRDIAAWLPFRHVIETPALLWLGQAEAGTELSLLAKQATTAVLLVAVGHGIFRTALSRHQIQGG